MFWSRLSLDPCKHARHCAGHLFSRRPCLLHFYLCRFRRLENYPLSIYFLFFLRFSVNSKTSYCTPYLQNKEGVHHLKTELIVPPLRSSVCYSWGGVWSCTRHKHTHTRTHSYVSLVPAFLSPSVECKGRGQRSHERRTEGGSSPVFQWCFCYGGLEHCTGLSSDQCVWCCVSTVCCWGLRRSPFSAENAREH